MASLVCTFERTQVTRLSFFKIQKPETKNENKNKKPLYVDFRLLKLLSHAELVPASVDKSVNICAALRLGPKSIYCYDVFFITSCYCAD